MDMDAVVTSTHPRNLLVKPIVVPGKPQQTIPFMVRYIEESEFRPSMVLGGPTHAGTTPCGHGEVEDFMNDDA